MWFFDGITVCIIKLFAGFQSQFTIRITVAFIYHEIFQAVQGDNVFQPIAGIVCNCESCAPVKRLIIKIGIHAIIASFRIIGNFTRSVKFFL